MAPASASPSPSDPPDGEQGAGATHEQAGQADKQAEIFGAVAVERLRKEDGRELILYAAVNPQRS
jgi:hypothetical protein